MKKKLFAILVIAAMMIAAISGCAGSASADNDSTTTTTTQEDSTTPEADSNDVGSDDAETGIKTINDVPLTKIGLSVAAMDNEFTTNLADTLKEAAAEYGVEVIVSEAGQTTAKQVEQIENMVVSGCEAICVIPVDINGILDALKDAKDNGVVVSLCGVIPESMDYYDVVANVEQFDLGQSAAKAAANWIDATFPDAEDESIEVAVLALNNTEEAIKREQGLEQVAELTSKAKIVEVYDATGSSSIPTKAQEFTEMMLISHPDVKVIMAYSDFMGLPADEVIMRTPSIEKSEFGIFGCDYSEAGCQAIDKSISDESTYRASGAFGVKFGKTMFDTVVGNVEVDEQGVYYEPAFELDASNVSEYLK